MTVGNDMLDNCSRILGRMGLGGVPKFHLEYTKKYRKEKKEIQKLTTVQREFSILSAVGSNPALIAKDLEEEGANPNIFLKRWGNNALDKEFHIFLETMPMHSIYEQKTNVYNPKVFQSMKNYNLPEWIFDYGKIHVSVGCVDFQQLLLGRLNPREDKSPLVFHGIDSSSVSVARCLILNQMMKNGANPKHILQVWFSSAWSNQTSKDFLEQNNIDVSSVPKLWAKDLFKQGRNNPFEACANFEHEVDRVDYARYLFTGFIFVDENELQQGNITMFCIPENMDYEKAEEENFFHTFNFYHPQFEYENNLMFSVEDFMTKKVAEVMKEVQSQNIKMFFQVASVGPDTIELLKQLQEMEAYTIDWSNIMDYFSKEDFLSMAKMAGSQDTVHYVHLMNWVCNYNGASVFDYQFQDKVELIEHALQTHKGVHQAQWDMVPNYAKMWPRQLKYQNVTNLVDYGLTEACRTNYIEHIFGREIGSQIKISSAAPGLRRSQTTICGAFTFDTETTLATDFS